MSLIGLVLVALCFESSTQTPKEIKYFCLNFFHSCVLLTTDVAARGLDIPNVQYIFHYQVRFLFFLLLSLAFNIFDWQYLCSNDMSMSPI